MNAAYKYDILSNNEYDLPTSRSRSISAVKGLTMNHERNLSNYAEELVSDYAKFKNDEYELFLSDLPESEQNELVRLYIEYTGRDLVECVNGNDFAIDNEYTCALLSMLKHDSQRNREKFAEVTRKNTILYFEKNLQEVLNDACHNYFNNRMNEEGYYANQDMQHGDIYWSKC